MATPGYTQYAVTVKGTTLICHNGQLADPLNKYARALKELSSKRNKTDADLEQMAILEFKAGLYTNDKQEVILPARIFESALAEGAKKSREGKLALSGLFVDDDAVLRYEGGPKSVEELAAEDKFRLTVPVCVNRARIMRTRPFFQNWSACFYVSLNPDAANEAQLRRWIEAAGAFVGLCDWRPRHGRYEVVDFSRLPSKRKQAT